MNDLALIISALMVLGGLGGVLILRSSGKNNALGATKSRGNALVISWGALIFGVLGVVIIFLI